jgi:hypothetical protein
MTKQALAKIENFVKIALDEISELSTKVAELENSKISKDKELDNALKKAAEAMYSSDFINDEEEKLSFMKKAKEDPKYLARVVERVCQAADVAYMGKAATVKASNHADDPVLRRAFGYDQNYSLLED